MNNIYIVADCKPFKTIGEAAYAEKQIDWWDAQDERIRPCVECFAAMEIYSYLNTIKESNMLPWTIGVIPREEAANTVSDLFIWVGSNSFLPNIMAARSDVKVGRNLHIPESREGYIIQCDKIGSTTHWMLDGVGPKGTLNASYELLERLGIRWYGTGDRDMVIPKIGAVQDIFFDKLVVIDEPKYKTRGVYNEFLDDRDEQMIKWIARARANFIYVDKINNPHLLKKLGIGLVGGGHIIQRDYLNPNALSEDGVRTYSQAHPEWYGFVDGARRFDIGQDGVGGYNFCSSNSEAADEMCNNVVRSLCDGSLRHVDYINFWMLDMGRWCECENCAASGNYTSRLIRLVYRLSKKVRESRLNGKLKRDIKILFPVYLETIKPPDRPVPADFDYEVCLPTFFPIERCYLHDIDDPACTETNADIMNVYRPWAQDADRYYKGELFLGEYFNVSAFANLPFQFTEIIKHDILFYFESGIKHLYFFHFPSGKVGPLKLTNYLIYKMLWDPYIDTEKLINEYFLLFFDDAEHIKDVYSGLEKLSENAKYFKHFQHRSDVRLSLTEKLEVLNGDLFPLKHMHMDSVDKEQGGISVYQMLDEVHKCRLDINRALFCRSSGIVQVRLLEDEGRLTYLERMIWFLYYFSLSKLALDRDERLVSEAYYRHAESYAALLERDETSVKRSHIFSLYDNALKASWCRGGFEKLGELLKGNFER